MVLKCTGSLLVKESSSERNALFEKAMSVLQSVGMHTLSVSLMTIVQQIKANRFLRPCNVAKLLEITRFHALKVLTAAEKSAINCLF